MWLFNYVAYIAYKWQGLGNHKMNVPHKQTSTNLTQLSGMQPHRWERCRHPSHLGQRGPQWTRWGTPWQRRCTGRPAAVTSTETQITTVMVVLAFSSLARIFGRMVDHSLPACAFVWGEGGGRRVEISLCTLIPLFMPGSVHSGSASWDECSWTLPDKLHVSLLPYMFPHYAWTAA